LANFDQLPTGGLCGGASAIWRENWSKEPPFRAQDFDQLVKGPSKISEISGLQPVNFDPSMSLQAQHCLLGCSRLPLLLDKHNCICPVGCWRNQLQ
jgi:hypothetical protein